MPDYEYYSCNPQFTAIPVIYSGDRVCIHSINTDSIEKDSLSAFTKSISSKSPEWSYEKEWQIIRDDTACGDKWNDEKRSIT